MNDVLMTSYIKLESDAGISIRMCLSEFLYSTHHIYGIYIADAVNEWIVMNKNWKKNTQEKKKEKKSEIERKREKKHQFTHTHAV